ncbi:hypothetical protein MPSEU_000286800 [Mayamaea pseudoterrestris]|nr:hypothetical protein MPSEU_000286800 [Mayamaea pseudoterrestris]
MMKFRRPSSRSSLSKDTSVTQSQSSNPLSPRSSNDPYRSFRSQGVTVPISEDGRIQAVHEIAYKTPDSRYRSMSAQRAAPSSRESEELRIIGRDDGRHSSSRGRSHSRSREQGRSQSQGPVRSRSRGRKVDDSYDHSRHNQRSTSVTRHSSYRPGSEGFHMSEPTLSVDTSEDENKKRKSKMEKIRQLQAKNELYKEEFKKVQRDRKKLKKELEAKGQEIESLTNEIDAHVAETSRLKSQLSEVMMFVDRRVEDDGKEKHALKALQKELDAAKADHESALRRVSELKNDLKDLKEYVRRKDEQLETLTLEVSEQQQQLHKLKEEKKSMFNQMNDKGLQESTRVIELCKQNDNLKTELDATVERAANMVQEREEAIADLLKENDELKGQLTKARSESNADRASHEEIDQLREELQQAQASLEEAQDRNVLLEEEIEQWINRGSEMEGSLERLESDVATWRDKATDAQSSLEEVQSQLVDAQSESATHKDALRLAQAKFEADVVALKEKHNASIADIEARAFAERVEKPAPSQQAMLLEQAVAKQRDPAKLGAANWRKFLAGAPSEDGSDSGEKDKRLRELQEENQARSDEIKALKSELVKLRSSYNEAMYVHKKKIESLEEENNQHVDKIASLEHQLREGSAFEKYLKERQASVTDGSIASE